MAASSSSSTRPKQSRSSARSVDHLLLLDGLADRGQAVTQPAGPFVLQGVRGLEHLRLQALDDRLGVAVEERHQVADQRLVGVAVDVPTQGPEHFSMWYSRQGLPEPLVGAELVVAAGADREGPQQRVEGLPDGVGVGVGTEVPAALVLGAPPDHGSRPLVADRHGQERVALVVPQPDVEAGLVLLDQAVLEHDRFDVVADLDPLDALGLRHHLGRPEREVGGVLEVVGQPAAQRLGLADVDDPSVSILGTGRSPGRRGWCRRAGGQAPFQSAAARCGRGFWALFRSGPYDGMNAGPVSGDISTSRSTSPRTGDRAVPADHIEVLRPGGLFQCFGSRRPYRGTISDSHERRSGAPDRGGQGSRSAPG